VEEGSGGGAGAETIPHRSPLPELFESQLTPRFSSFEEVVVTFLVRLLPKLAQHCSIDPTDVDVEMATTNLRDLADTFVSRMFPPGSRYKFFSGEQLTRTFSEFKTHELILAALEGIVLSPPLTGVALTIGHTILERQRKTTRDMMMFAQTALKDTMQSLYKLETGDWALAFPAFVVSALPGFFSVLDHRLTVWIPSGHFAIGSVENAGRTSYETNDSVAVYFGRVSRGSQISVIIDNDGDVGPTFRISCNNKSFIPTTGKTPFGPVLRSAVLTNPHATMKHSRFMTQLFVGDATLFLDASRTEELNTPFDSKSGRLWDNNTAVTLDVQHKVGIYRLGKARFSVS